MPEPDQLDVRAAIADRIMAFLRSSDYVAVQEMVVYLETIENKLRPDALANFRHAWEIEDKDLTAKQE
jgi:hypothetical protein